MVRRTSFTVEACSQRTRTSSTNAARIYNEYMTSPEPSTPSSHDMPTHKLNNHHVFDAFVIVSLLEDSKCEGSVLRVPHTGDQRDRFACAMEARNFRIRTFGQPAASHWCTKCMRTLPGENGTMRKSNLFIASSTLAHSWQAKSMLLSAMGSVLAVLAARRMAAPSLFPLIVTASATPIITSTSSAPLPSAARPLSTGG